MSLELLYQDDCMIAVNKPSGLMVHRSLMDRGASEFALQKVRDQIGKKVFPVHRLDRATSGVLLFGLSSEMARELAEKFSSGQVEKSYLAVVRGVLTEDICLNYPLKEELDAKADKRADKNKPPQSAITHFSRLASFEFPILVDKFPTTRYSLVKAKPKTGRKHQIRRHLRHLGHPIVGDVRHGSGKHNRFFREHLGSHRLLLACTDLTLRHPTSNKKISIHAPLASEFKETLKKMGWGTYD